MILLSAILLVLVAALWAAALLLPFTLWVPSLATAGAVAVVLGLFLWRRHRARVAAGEIEKTLRSQADAHAQAVRPDQQAEIEAMEAEFQKAVAALKTSKLARGGRDALAILPWYLIVGPPGAGKSTALRNSGLQFPYLSARGGGVRGVGGTRNCDWWLTNEAVILDTAGRYTTEDEDREEWASFLDTLARARPKMPINGLLVAVSVGDLGGESEEGCVELAKKIRERLDEVMFRLQMVLPAYLLFTKCDLLPGFVETFSDLRKQERGQIWGFTAGVDEGREAPGDLFRTCFDELAEVVDGRAVARLGEERHLELRARIFQFPQQLRALRTNLATFVDTLYAANVYQDSPVMRGVYFTSGTQEGRTIDRVMGAMASAFGVRPRAGAGAPALEAKSYFLRDVFKQVVFPDQNLAVRSAGAVRRQQLRRYGLAALAAAAALVLFAFPLRSYLLNRSLVQSTDALMAQLAAALKATQSTPRLDVLDPLRERLELLERHELGGAPWAQRLGLYQGQALIPPVRLAYAAAARRLVVEPVFALEVEEMDAFVRRLEKRVELPSDDDYAAQYDRLKLHLLLSGPRGPGEPRVSSEADRAWLTERLADRWSGGAQGRDPGAARRVTANAALFSRLLVTDPGLALTRYDDLVRRMRGVMARVSFTSLAVDRLVRVTEPKGLDLALPVILGEPVPLLRNETRVRGAFTRKGYEESIKPLLDDPAALLEPWVLARDGKDEDDRLAEAAGRLRSRYFERYIDEWRRFLEATHVDVAAGSGALAVLQELTRGEPPPYARLFRAVAYNARVGGLAGQLEKAGQGVLEKVRNRLGAGGKAAAAALQGDPTAERELGPREVERAFAGFASFAVAPEPAPGAPAPAATPTPGGAPPRSMPLDLYQEHLAYVRDALQATLDGGPPAALVERVSAARTKIRALIDGAEIGWRPRLEALLWPPLDAASRDTARQAASGASQEWCAAVSRPFRRGLAGKYPFTANGDDAALADLAEFFRPGGIVWGFYDGALKADVQRTADGFKFARQLGGVSGYRGELLFFLARAQDVTSTLFPAGATEPKVEFSVRVRPTPGVAVIWFEVDGQRFDYRNGPEEWHKLTWPGAKTPGASIRVRAAGGQEEVLQQEGEWGLFRLIEAGKLKGPPGARDFSVSWSLPSMGASVTIDFRPARSDAPFFGVRRPALAPRLLGSFRGGVAPPAAISSGGPGCG